ncbi:MAG: hypothetical protein ACKPE3_17235 [Sphaerospermopsis kisseleviana]
MVKITGNLHINTGFIRIKPNINFIGSTQGITVHEIHESLEIELNPTPIEGVYLVDYSLDSTSSFVPSEHWIIPNKDCTFDEVRGIKNPDDIVLKLQEQITKLTAETAELSRQVIQFNLENSQLSLDIEQYQEQIKKLEKSEKSTKHEIDSEVVEHSKINTSFDILNRFASEQWIVPTKNSTFDIAKYQEKIVKLTAETNELSKNYQKQITQLTTETSELSKHYQKQITKLTTEIAELSRQVVQLNLENSQLNFDIVQYQEQITKLTAKTAELSEQVVQLNLENSQLNLDIEQYQEQITRLSTELTEQVVQLNLENTQLSLDIEQYQGQITKLTAELTGQVIQLNLENSQLSLDIAQYQKQVTKLTAESAELAVQYQEQITKLTAESAELSGQVIQLNLENSQLSLDISQYHKQIKELEESEKSANHETNTEVVEPDNINTSFDILSRFA